MRRLIFYVSSRLAIHAAPGEDFHMSITATVQDGKILLPPDLHWPTGTTVRVELLSPSVSLDAIGLQPGEGPSCFDLCKDLFENLEPGGPDDLSTNPRHLEDFGR